MTRSGQKEICKTQVGGALKSVIILGLTVYFAIGISGSITGAVIDGMRLAALTVLPATFPFMIISDLYFAYGYPERISILGRFAEKHLHLPRAAVRALLLGNLAGFPIGAKIAAELYTGGGIDKKNAEKLIAYSNNPSIPFVVTCVGKAMLKDEKIGIFLLIIVYASTIITALIFRSRGREPIKAAQMPNHSFSIVKSVKNAGAAAISILSFIVTFYTGIALLKQFIKNEYILSLIASFFELTGGVSITSSLALPLLLKLPLVAFALGFGGLSVMMQTALFTSEAGLSLAPYFKIKLIMGVISAALCAFCCPLVLPLI